MKILSTYPHLNFLPILWLFYESYYQWNVYPDNALLIFYRRLLNELISYMDKSKMNWWIDNNIYNSGCTIATVFTIIYITEGIILQGGWNIHFSSNF